MSKVRVLVVDDDPWILRMVSASLEKKGNYDVETARDGQQALQHVQAAPPDMIITDVMMPVMDGWTFVQHVRQDPTLAQIPVLFLTALGKDEQRLHALGLRPGDYVSKPFRFDDLERAVNRALSGGAQDPTSTSPGFGGASTGYPTPPGFGPPPQPQRGGAPSGQPYGQPYGQPGPGQMPYPNQGQQPYGQPQPPYPPQPGPYGPPQSPSYPYPQNAPPNPGQPGQPYGQPQPQHPAGPYGQPSPQAPPAHGYPGQPYGQPGQAPAAPYGQPPQGYPNQPPHGPGPPPDQGGGGLNAGSSGAYPAATTGQAGTRRRRNTGLNGRLEQLGLSSLLVMMEMERKDGVLALSDGETKRVGRIFLRKGQVVHAKLDEDEDTGPRECVYQMLCWQKGKFSFGVMEVDMEDTVKTSTTSLLMEGARLIDESNR